MIFFISVPNYKEESCSTSILKLKKYLCCKMTRLSTFHHILWESLTFFWLIANNLKQQIIHPDCGNDSFLVHICWKEVFLNSDNVKKKVKKKPTTS